MEQHTPGPWTTGICQVTKDFLKGRLSEAVVTETGEVIALTGEGEANARLIASAPELFDALVECLRMLGAPEGMATEMARSKAIYAITKAKGED